MRFGEETEAVLGLTGRMKALREQRCYAEARAAGTAGRSLALTKRDAELLDVALALATYKDPEYPVRKGLNEASALLARHVNDSRDRAVGRRIPRVAVPHRRPCLARGDRPAPPRRGSLLRLGWLAPRRGLSSGAPEALRGQAGRGHHVPGLRRAGRPHCRAFSGGDSA